MIITRKLAFTKEFTMKQFLVVIGFYCSMLASSIAQEQPWQPVEKIFDRKGATRGDVFKITFPRSDLTVKIGAIRIDPGLALTSWVAFLPMPDQSVMTMGDLVMLGTEVGPVTKKLVQEGIEVTALHNHLINESPKDMYMHFSGQGDAVKLAESIKKALAETKTPMGPAPSSPPVQKPDTDWSKVEVVLGYTGTHKGKLLQVSVPRVESITEMQMDIPPFMGTATGINFQREGNKAATTGDFVLVADEVPKVVKELTIRGIQVTAIHNHMLNETPRMFMVHFWGYDDPEKLARGLRAALDKTNSVKK